MIETGWKVNYVSELPKFGDASRYEFSVHEYRSGETSTVIVRVSRSLLKFLEGKCDPIKVAAHGVRLHLQGRLRKKDYSKGEVNITQYSPQKYDEVDLYQEFEVEKPSKNMGLIP